MTTLIINTDKFMTIDPYVLTFKRRDDGSILVHDRSSNTLSVQGEWHAVDTQRNTFPLAIQHDTRVDVKFRDGTVHRGCMARSWQWGEARETTITHYRLAAKGEAL